MKNCFSASEICVLGIFLTIFFVTTSSGVTLISAAKAEQSFFAVGDVATMTPIEAEDFLVLSDGRDLKKILVSGSALSRSVGTGLNFGKSQQLEFEKLRAETESDYRHDLQWALMNLDQERMVARSRGADRKIFGASSSKIFISASFADFKQGNVSNSQLQQIAEMIAISSNTAWTDLQAELGDGDADTGRARVQAFTQRMGYEQTRGYQGTWGNLHGNELTAAELVEFLRDTYKDRYLGAEVTWKMIHTSRTGSLRGKKYLPINLYVGGKTGTYDGDSIDPDTGLPTFPDGSPYQVHVRNHVLVFKVKGVQYGLAILANTASDESAALIAGGFYQQLAQ